MFFIMFRFVAFNLLISLEFLQLLSLEYSHPAIPKFLQTKPFGMRIALILALYFFLIAVIALLLTPTYFLEIFETNKTNCKRTSGN